MAAHSIADAKCIVEACNSKAKARGWCNAHYLKWMKYGDPLYLRPMKPWCHCTVEGCEALSRTKNGKLCETHYYRRRRTGTVADPVYRGSTIGSNGYVVLLGKAEHPLVGSNGRLYEHRAVLFEKIGPGVHACHWCCEEVEWKAKGKRKLVADHLDSDKQNNAPSNLVPSCHACNGNRGLFMSWVMKHRDDPFLADLFRHAGTSRPRSGGHASRGAAGQAGGGVGWT